MLDESNGNGQHSSNGHSQKEKERHERLANNEQIRRFEIIVDNAIMSRERLFQRLMDPRRNLNAECGYPETEGLHADDYKRLYEREPIATRVVQLLPKESWQMSPSIYEDEDPDNETEFEKAWDTLSQQLRGDQSWFQDEQGSPIWEHLQRADILSGIGFFGVILLGIDDGKPLDQPVEGVVEIKKPTNNATSGQVANVNSCQASEIHIVDNRSMPVDAPGFQDGRPVPKDVTSATSGRGKNSPTGNAFVDKTDANADSKRASFDYASVGTDAQYMGVQMGPSQYPSTKPYTGKPRKLIFLRSFDESLVQIVQYEANVLNPRFGQPVMYLITLNDPREQHSGIGLPMAMVRVHWSRVIHIADNRNSSEVFGTPRLRPVLNRVLDLAKLYGASAEGYWKSCFAGLSFQTHPQLGGDVKVDPAPLKDMVESYQNGLQRALFTSGMAVSTLAPSVVDPASHINMHIEAICIELGCPVRVFKGSERGELASSQDDASWNDRLRARQNLYITPFIIVPFIDRLIQIGVLPIPKVKKRLRPDVKPPTNLTDPVPTNVPPVPDKKPQPSGGGGPGEAGNPFGESSRSPLARGSKPNLFTTNAFSVDDTEDLEAPISPKKSEGAKGNKGVKGKQVLTSEAGYSIEWPDLDSLGDKDKAAIFAQRMTAYASYVSGGIEAVIPPMDLMTKFDNLTDEEAITILMNAQEAQEEKQEAHADIAETHGMEPTAPPGFEKKPPPPPPMPLGGPIKLKEGEKLVSPSGAPVKPAKSPLDDLENPATENYFHEMSDLEVRILDAVYNSGFASDEQREAFFGLLKEEEIRSAGGDSSSKERSPKRLKHEITKVEDTSGWGGARYHVGDKNFLSSKDANAHVSSLKTMEKDATNEASKSREVAKEIYGDYKKSSDHIFRGQAEAATEHAERLEKLAGKSKRVTSTQKAQKVRDAIDKLIKDGAPGIGSPRHKEHQELVGNCGGLGSGVPGPCASVKNAKEGAEKAQGVLAKWGAKVDSFIKSIPVIGTAKKAVDGAMSAIKDKLADRYGDKAAGVIMASGSLGGFGVTALAIKAIGFTVPGVTDLISIAGHVAIAEGLKRLGYLKGRDKSAVGQVANALANWLLTLNDDDMEDIGMSEEEIADVGAQTYRIIAKTYARAIAEHSEEINNALKNPDEDTKKLLADAKEHAADETLKAKSKAITNPTENCGGPGSGVPGPCPGWKTGVTSLGGKNALEKLKQSVKESATKRGGTFGLKGMRDLANAMGLKGHQSLNKADLAKAILKYLDVKPKAVTSGGVKTRDKAINKEAAKVNKDDKGYKSAMKDINANGPRASKASVSKIKEANKSAQFSLEGKGILPDDIHLVPSHEKTPPQVGEKPTKERDYLDRLQTPASSRFKEIKEREQMSGIPFRERVVNAVIGDSKLQLPGVETYRDRVSKLSYKGEVTPTEQSGMQHFRASVVDAIKRGEVEDASIVRALEHVDNTRYGTMHLNEFHATIHKGH